MDIRKSSIAFLLFIVSSVLVSAPVLAARDTKGSADHPLLSRYPGMYIDKYAVIEYDEAELIAGTFNKRKRTAKTLRLEGKVTNILYINEKRSMNASVLQMYKNYEKALKRLKAKILYSCRGSSCYYKKETDFGLFLGNWTSRRSQMLKGIHKKWGAEIGLITAVIKNRTGGNVHVMVTTAVDAPNKKRYVMMSFVESDSLDTDKIAIGSPSDLQKGIDAEGKVELAGIYFDHNKSTIKPESQTVLDIIAKYLKSNPSKTFYVVGHTDNSGQLDYNMNLSQQRASAVVRALVNMSIKNKRLTARGVGPLSPNASNRSEDGKASNRRVELVENQAIGVSPAW